MPIEGSHPHVELASSPGQLVPLDIKKREHESGVEERAELRRDEIMWKRMQRSEAALCVEEYFRTSPYQPSVENIMMQVDLPPDVVDKKFLQICAGVAERFRRQVADSTSAIERLEKEVTRLGAPANSETIAQGLYRDMKGKFPQGRMTLRRVQGFLLLCVESNQDYDELYSEQNALQKSGGRFHRSRLVNIANREVPLIVRRGIIQGSGLQDKVVVHEVQHWINEGLVSLGAAEEIRPSLLRLGTPERLVELNKTIRRRSIKDEVLAYIRDGSGASVAATLSGDLYTNLFSGTSLETAQEHAILRDIGKEISSFFAYGFDDRMRAKLVYSLIDVELESIPGHIKALRKMLDRINATLRDPEYLADRDFSDIRYVPSRYQGHLHNFKGAQTDIRLVKDALLKPGNGKARKLAELHHDFMESLVNAGADLDDLMPEKTWVPYATKIDGVEKASSAEVRNHEKAVFDVLDVLSRIPETRIHQICSELSSEQALAEIAKHIREVVADNAYIDEPTVAFRVDSRGIQVRVSYESYTGPAAFTAYVTRKPSSVDSYGAIVGEGNFLDVEPTVFDGNDIREDPLVPTRATQRIYEELNDARHAYGQAKSRRASMGSPSPTSTQDLQRARAQYLKAREQLFRHGAHIPEIFYSDIPAVSHGEPISNEVVLSIDNFREALATAANKINQDTIDGWLRGSSDAEQTERIRTEIRQAIIRPIGETYGKGKLRNITLGDIYHSDEFLTVVIDFTTESERHDRLPSKIVVRLHCRQ
ncbi:MAG: hypothetical protein NUV56_02585 [Candidatus Uhrbacteria bacterium]|nr:hypothetical protein [Candidatus Uhrbacteria bacterium]